MCSTSSAMPSCSTWPPATAGYSAWACAFHRSQWLRPGPACRREPGSWESGRQGILLASWLNHQHPPTSSIYHDISTIQGRWCSWLVGYDWLCIWIKPLQTLASATLLAGAARAGATGNNVDSVAHIPVATSWKQTVLSSAFKGGKLTNGAVVADLIYRQNYV